MPPSKADFLQGVIPACLMPFAADLEIDERAYRRHLRDLAGVDGISAITINGHAAEVHALTAEEQERSLASARETLERTPVIAGIYADGSKQAGDLARKAQREGADALLIFPPQSLSLGGQLRPESAFAHFQAIVDRTDLPLILFQYPMATGLGYPLATLLELCGRFPSIKAVKDWCNDPVLHERHIRLLHGLTPRVNVLTTHSAWLLSSLVLGCDGLLSGAGSVIAPAHVALWRAVQGNDLRGARAVYDDLYPLVRAFYEPPLYDMHNRMKEALVLLGRLPAAHVRPPLVKLSSNEIGLLEKALRDSGLMPATAARESGCS